MAIKVKTPTKVPLHISSASDGYSWVNDHVF
jgi:hypothetical protein